MVVLGFLLVLVLLVVPVDGTVGCVSEDLRFFRAVFVRVLSMVLIDFLMGAGIICQCIKVRSTDNTNDWYAEDRMEQVGGANLPCTFSRG